MRRTAAGIVLVLACATGCTGGSDEADVEESTTPTRETVAPQEDDGDCPMGVDTDGDGDRDPDPMLPDCYVVGVRW